LAAGLEDMVGVDREYRGLADGSWTSDAGGAKRESVAFHAAMGHGVGGGGGATWLPWDAARVRGITRYASFSRFRLFSRHRALS
jgi:hypothetical protein